MRKLSIIMVIIPTILMTSLTSYADHFRGRPWIGPEWYGHTYVYPYPYYVDPPIIVQQPDVYVVPAPQQAPPRTEPAFYWYYCQNPPGYYPYVKTCPEGWMKVVPSLPQPPDLKR